jgi:isoquinoline 1-oxidoreductase alpha subunit
VTKIKVNGKLIQTRAAPQTPLLWVLRDELKLFGTKFGCGAGLCGACTVHVDGKPVRACLTPAASLGEAEVTTIEGLQGQPAEALKAAWQEVDVVQCGYCQSGQLMSACALLREHPSPTDEQIIQAMDGNVCRCGTYPRIKAAIRLAAQKIA